MCLLVVESGGTCPEFAPVDAKSSIDYLAVPQALSIALKASAAVYFEVALRTHAAVPTHLTMPTYFWSTYPRVGIARGYQVTTVGTATDVCTAAH